MRRSVKFRLIFLMSAIASYWLGFHFLPQSVEADNSKVLLVGFSTLYFILLPLLYWFCIIKIGEQKLWKMLLIFSLSSLMARLSFPVEVASYFEFIAWMRYPIIAVLLAIQLFLMVSIVKGLWQARSLSGDPRVHILDTFQEQDDKKRSLALVMASEPASWYYAIPYLSRKHTAAITALRLRSASIWTWLLMIVSTLVSAGLAHYIISPWSEIAAIIVSSIISYSVVMVTANYRISKNYSLYRHQDKLIINNSVWGFMSIKFADIADVELGEYNRKEDKEGLHFGYGDSSNIKLIFRQPQTYFGGLGQLTERVDTIDMQVSDPQALVECIQTYQDAEHASSETLSDSEPADMLAQLDSSPQA
ncbi:MAG: hypothetical protein ACI90A_001718 [Shewanella sp.]|jgi:hypothetical protein